MKAMGKLIWVCVIGLAVSTSVHATIISAVADETIQLSAAGITENTASIAYDPDRSLYYGSRAGSTDYTAAVWDVSGALQQTLSPMNIDARGWNYNGNTNELELVTYTSDLVTVHRDGTGLLTGVYTTQLNDMAGSPSTQAMLSYNQSLNIFYGMVSGPSISVIDHDTGTLIGTIALDFAAAGITSLNSYFIGYDELEDALIGTSGDRAYVFSTGGGFLGSSLLGFSPDSNLDAGYANGQLFVYSSDLGGFQGYDIFENSVPEPASIALIGLGFAGLVFCRRRTKA